MNARIVETLVGFFVLLFLVAMFILSMRVSNLASFSGGGGYSLIAYFDNVGGLKKRAPVAASGVRVGQVTDISYDTTSYKAKVTIKIDEEFAEFPSDTNASILTSGLLGEQYIGLDPGGLDTYLADGDQFDITQSALVLEKLIGNFFTDR